MEKQKSIKRRKGKARERETHTHTYTVLFITQYLIDSNKFCSSVFLFLIYNEIAN